MSVKIPQPFFFDDFGVDADVNFADLPTHYTFSVDALPKIQIGTDPAEVSLRITEFPSVRTHFPADFKLGFSLLGVEFAVLRVCGKAQAISEPFRPNPCEECADPAPGQVARTMPRLTLGGGR